MVSVFLSSPAATAGLGRALAHCLRPPALVTLAGELGTGKTALVRAILRARGVREQVVSPSFTIAQSYRGRGGLTLHHLDLYRLSPGADVELFAWEDYIGSAVITFVEWPEAGDLELPAADVRVCLFHAPPRSRRAEIVAGADFEERLRARLEAGGLPASPGVADRSGGGLS